MISTLTLADRDNAPDMLKQMDFFLFLADSVEVDGELTTLVDMEAVELDTLSVEATAESVTDKTSLDIDRENLTKAQEEQP